MKFSSYPDYKESGVEWLGEVPVHWDIAPVGLRYQLRNGFPFSAESFSPEGSVENRVVRIRDILGNDSPIYTAELCASAFLVEDGDVLIGMDGDFNIAFWSEGKAKLNQRVCAIRGSSDRWDRFFFYGVRCPVKIINDLTFSTTVKHLASSQVLKIRFPFPPTSEMELIIRFLDHETARIDELIEEQQRLIELLKEKRQAAISHAVTKGLDLSVPMKDSGAEWLGEVPAHWEVLATKRFFRMVTDPAPNDNDYELLSVYTEIGVRPRKELEQKGNKASTTDGYWRVKRGDLIVNKLLAWMGAVGYSDYDGVTSPAYDILRPSRQLSPKFYHYIFRGKPAQQEFKRWSRGIMEMRLRLYFDELGRISMPFPPLGEQEDIVNFIETMEARFDSLSYAASEQVKLLSERRSALISAAVTGKIDVRGWEPPASAQAPESVQEAV